MKPLLPLMLVARRLIAAPLRFALAPPLLARRLIRALTCVVITAALITLAACARPFPPQQVEFALGTVCSVNLYEHGSNQLYSRIFARIREIDQTMSVAGLSMISQNAGVAPTAVGPDVLEVLEKALHYAELSGGAFDPTIGPLVELWGIGTENGRVPGDEEIAEALALVDWRDLIVDREAGTAFLRRPGMSLDLGAIAKGYAADEAARLAKEGGAARGIFDLGGDIAALGSRGGGRGSAAAGAGNVGGGATAAAATNATAAPWRIGIQDPLGGRGEYIGILPAVDRCVVTSGVYERYFEAEGQRYHHILSTADGRPADNGLLSVTVVADRAVDADGLSTALFVMGCEQGLLLLDTIPGADAVFVFSDRTVRVTDGLRHDFTLTDDAYTLR